MSTGRPSASAAEHLDLTRVGWTLACALLLLFGLQNWASGAAMPLMVWISVLNTVASLVLASSVWASSSVRWQPVSAMVMLTLVSLAVAASSLATTSGYGTDAMAFNEYSARLAISGENPYSHSMLPAIADYHIPVTNTTLTFSGDFVTRLSYPAGSFLFYAAAILGGLTFHTAPIVNAVAWVVTLWVMFVLLPRPYRWIAVVFGTATSFAGLSSAGLSDVQFLPFLLLAVYRWDRFGDRRLPLLVRLAGPISLGVACSIKQTPWFAVPFLVIGVFMSEEDRREGLRLSGVYAAVAALSFGVLNLPFVLSAPNDWLRGITLPLREPLIADGQGLVSLAALTGVGGGNVQLFTAAGLAAYAALLCAFVTFHDSFKRAWVPLLALVLVMPARGLAIYAAMWTPVMIVAAQSVRTHQTRTWAPVRRMPGLIATGCMAIATVVSVVAALTTHAPLRLSVLDASVAPNGLVGALTVRIENTSLATARALMTVNANGQPSQVWSESGSTRQLVLVPPRATRTLRLYPQTLDGRPHAAGMIRLQAFTTGPRAVSVSRLEGPFTQSTTGPAPSESLTGETSR